MADLEPVVERITARRVASAYLAVFGREGARSADQKLVWRDMESFCRAYRLSVESVEGGAIPDNNFLVNEGRRSYWLRARGQILLALEPPPPPLKVNRRRVKP
jgi:hypothetical protein